MDNSTLLEPLLLSLPILLIGGVSLLHFLKPQKVNFIRIYILAFALHFAILPLYSFFKEWFSDRWIYNQGELFSAYLNLYFFLGGVLLVLFLHNRFPKKYRKGVTIPKMLENQYSQIALRTAGIFFIIVIGFLVGYNFAFGFTYYASGTLERNLSVPYPLVVLKSLASIFVFGLVGYGALHLIRGRRYFLFGLLLISSNVFLDWYSRRNYILVFLTLVLFKIIIDRFKVSMKQTILVGLIGIIVVKIFFPFLFIFRQITTEVAYSGQDATNLSKTFEVTQSKKGSLLAKDENENVEYRSNQIARNIEFMRFPGPEEKYMNGLILGTQIAAVIPRALYPAKIKLGKTLAPEGIILLFYGRNGFDLSDNLPLYGYLEFGYWGAFIAGIIQGIFLIIFEWFAYYFNRIHPFLGLSVFMFAIYNHLNLEYPYVQEFGLLRDIIILFLIFFTIRLFIIIFGFKAIK